MADIEDRVRQMFKRHSSDWRKAIKLMEEGRLKMSESIDGIWTDTTVRTIGLLPES